MSGYSFACGVKSLDLANPRQKNSNPSGEVNLSKKHYARLIGSEINALCRDGSVSTGLIVVAANKAINTEARP